MSSENVGFRPVITAAPGTPCGWRAYGEVGNLLTCAGDRGAIHILTKTLPVAVEGTALCAYHSPFDPTDAERLAVGQPAQTKGEAGAERLADVGRTGIEILTELVTLPTVGDTAWSRDRVIKFHRLSAPMIGVIEAVSVKRGVVGAWWMREGILTRVKGATKRTVKALVARGIIEEVSTEETGSGTGGLRDYILTDRGGEIAEYLGCPVTFLPENETAAAALAAGFTMAVCDDQCGTVMADGAVGLAYGGDVCMGCGATFVRSGTQAHPGVWTVSDAVVARNDYPRVGDVISYPSGPWSHAIIERFDGEHAVISLHNLSQWRPQQGTVLTAKIIESVKSGEIELRKVGKR